MLTRVRFQLLVVDGITPNKLATQPFSGNPYVTQLVTQLGGLRPRRNGFPERYEASS